MAPASLSGFTQCSWTNNSTYGSSSGDSPIGDWDWETNQDRYGPPYGPQPSQPYYPQPPIQYQAPDSFKDIETRIIIDALKNDVKGLTKKLAKMQTDLNKLKKQLNPPPKPGKRQLEL